MKSSIVTSILKKIGNEELIEVLANTLTPTDLQSIMLEVYHQKAAKNSPANLLRQYVTNRFVQPSYADPKTLAQLKLLAFAYLPKTVNLLELSPLTPLGNCSVLATVHQNKVVSTSRNTEVVADATNVLALESARQRQLYLKKDAKNASMVKLCTIHRHTRAQALKESYHTAHFSILCLTTAGRDTGNFKFEYESLLEHLVYYIQFSKEGLGQQEEDIKISLTPLTDAGQHLYIRLEEKLKRLFSGVVIEKDDSRVAGRGYYQSMCFKFKLKKEEDWFEVGDGGFTDWTQQLLNNKKERFLGSGLGFELLAKFFFYH